MFRFRQKGSFKNVELFLLKMRKNEIYKNLNTYAQMGVSALASATPVDSGISASSWGYEIDISRGSYTIVWTNSNVNNGFPVAIMLQYGHGTGTGGYVQGRDYINPAIQPIFDKIAENVWKEVVNS